MRNSRLDGFSLLEAVIAIALVGLSVAVTLGSLTQFNALAAVTRNATGAASLLQNQVDLFQSMSPFNPQPSKNQIPIDTTNTPATYDMTVGSHAIGFKDPISGLVSTLTDPWPVYREPSRWTYVNAAARTGASGFSPADLGQLAYQTDTQTFWRLASTAPTWSQDNDRGTIVRGTLVCTVTNISTSSMPNTYEAVFTLGYQFKGRGPIYSSARNRWEYQTSVTVIRTSDI